MLTTLFIGRYSRSETVSYIQCADALRGGRRDLALLCRAANPYVEAPEPPAALPQPTQRAIRTVAARVRASHFRDKVLRAYDHRCAFCGARLGLIDEVRIVPAAPFGGSDETSNGLALCPVHRRAFDAGLVTMTPTNDIVTREAGTLCLRRVSAGPRRAGVGHNLRRVVSLPPNPADRPASTNIVEGNRVRGWPKRIVQPVPPSARAGMLHE